MKRGFSIIELLVAIAILAILASVIIANLSAARRRSKIAQAKSDVSQIGAAVLMQYADTRKWPGYWETLYSFGRPELVRDVEMENFSLPEGGIVKGNICDLANMPASETVGLETRVPCYPNWKGPYYRGKTVDPWGEPYQLDYDFYGSPYKTVQQVVTSRGPDYNKSKSVNVLGKGYFYGMYSCDDIYFTVAKNADMGVEMKNFLKGFEGVYSQDKCSADPAPGAVN